VRIIKTEMYFDATDLHWPRAEELYANPGISVAFIKAEFPDGRELLKEIVSDRPIELADEGNELLIRIFLDEAVVGAQQPFRNRDTGDNTSDIDVTIHNADIVDFIFDADIIIERSPPHAVAFKALAKSASALSVGAYVGVAGLEHPLLFLTVPAGILVVGAAVSVSKAFERGLNLKVERVLKKLRRPHSPPRTRHRS
jgi:hypothetical protein